MSPGKRPRPWSASRPAPAAPLRARRFRRRPRAVRPFPDAGRCFPAPRPSCRSGAKRPAPSPPRIMVLIVLPPSESAMNAASAESGMEKKTATVARMLPRKTRIISPVRTRPMAPSWSSVSMAVLTNTDWSKTTSRPAVWGRRAVAERGLHAVDHGDGVGVAALLQHRQIDRRLAVDAHVVVLDLRDRLRPCRCRPPAPRPRPPS